MASLNDIAFSYASTVGKDLDVAYVRRIKFAIRYWRAMLVRQQAERTPINHAIVQSYVDGIELVDEADSCKVEAGCELKRTINLVPRPIQTKGSAPFMYVGPVSITCPDDIPFVYSSPAEIANAKYVKYTAHLVRYFYRNDRLYFSNNCLREWVRVTHPFEDPIQAADRCNIAANCVTDDAEFPIGLDMLNAIYEGLKSNEMRLLTPDEEANIELETKK